jgi:hypothetical protein
VGGNPLQTNRFIASQSADRENCAVFSSASKQCLSSEVGAQPLSPPSRRSTCPVQRSLTCWLRTSRYCGGIMLGRRGRRKGFHLRREEGEEEGFSFLKGKAMGGKRWLRGMRGRVKDTAITDLFSYTSPRVYVCLEQRVCLSIGANSSASSSEGSARRQVASQLFKRPHVYCDSFAPLGLRLSLPHS